MGSAFLTDTDQYDVKCCSRFYKAFDKTFFIRDVGLFLCGIIEHQTDIPSLCV